MSLNVKNSIRQIVEEGLSAYSILFFSNSRLLGVLLLAVTFFKPFAGLAGLISVGIALLASHAVGINRSDVQKGLFSFNALMIGIGMGTFYNSGIAFWLLLFIVVLLSVVLSGVLWKLLGQIGLPFLAIPFILCFWLVILVSREFSAIDLTTRNIYWLNEMYTVGDKPMVSFILFFEHLPLHPLVITFFKSLSSLFFQENVLAGIIIFIGLFLHSRIATSLVIIGYITSIAFNGVVHAYDSGINYYLMGGNFIMVTVAIGSFFVIPSWQSYLWAVFSVPITFIITIAFGKITSLFLLPVYTWPFCFVALLMIYFFSIKKQSGRLVLTPIQFYSPEKNVYNYLNTVERRHYQSYVQLQLPFLGQWIVSQGYEGNITHKGDWSMALDFVIVDAELKTYTQYALRKENFYCYNKPVLSPGYGYVWEIIDYIEDNEIGKINQLQNWGNTIIIKHAEGLYTKMCHLRKNSFKVKVGDYVKPGDVVAACGNSGRSPEPHLHFQVQTTPYVGSKTIAYPFSAYKTRQHTDVTIAEYTVPTETELVSNVVVNESLSRAFLFLPGFRMDVKAEGFEATTWEVFTDAYNANYLYCYQTKSVAYFGRQSNLFYFISFYGDQNSLLYFFYLSAYKINLSVDTPHTSHDQFPLQLSKSNIGKWLQDIVAPFYIFRRLQFESKNEVMSGNSFQDSLVIHSKQTLQHFSIRQQKASAEIHVEDGKIAFFQFSENNKTIQVTCTPKG